MTSSPDEALLRPRHDLRLVPAAALAWALAAWAVGQPSWVALTAAGACVALAALVRRPVFTVSACLVGVVAASAAWQVAAVEGSPVRAWAERGVTVEVVLEVTVDGRAYRAPGGDGVVLAGQVVEGTSRLGAVRDGGAVTVFVPATATEVDVRDLTVGRRVAVTARASPSDDPAEVAVLGALDVEVLPGVPWWWAMSERVRTGVRESVSHEPLDPRALVPALVDGDDAAVSDPLEEDFRRSGLTHLLAVSGTNLTIVLAAVLGVARVLGVRRRWWVVLGLVAVVGFVLVARPEPSVLRAAAMGVVGIVALGVGAAGGVRALAVAVLALLVVDPWLGRSPGFVLSVCATAGIVVLAPPLVTRMRWLPRWAAVATAVPLAAQVACTPALVALSGELSVVAVLANIVAAPAVAPTTVAGLLGGLLWLLHPALGSVAGTIAALGARWLVGVARHAGGLDGAAVSWAGPWWVSLVVVPVAAVVLWWLLRRPAVTIGLVVGLAVVVWRPPSPGWPPDDWVLVACDVGQGDGLVIDAGEGRAVVVDTGMEPEPIDRCLSRLGIDRVSALVLTHADADHVAGWQGVTRDRAVDTVVVGASGGPDVPGVPVELAAAGDVIEVGPVRLEVLWPLEREPTPGEDRNDLSLVLRLEVDGVRLLLTGDVEPEAQRAILRAGTDVRADVLKVPHHGSAHQDPDFVLATGASVALLSAGRDNDYGHPAPSTLELLARLGATWWRTDLQGDLGVVVRDGGLRVLTRD
ncbi:DNA internalization-related competence protein ComEC/Rec2 [Aeromicrobium sp. Leaf350]|uniref:DNA internalization-related competence protein ComEC/Rec2 n=1 Tax=Aeromicrobium sp. Leaf350 TaxID=2876565 RepID=UPI001E60A30C|nr:DNA internalization-related competence protein ComEC/Rec2 [Aeromicrobium sp. Leaf350]